MDFRNDFSLTNIATSAINLEDIINSAVGEDIKTAFSVTAKIRNTTGHNLMRDDIFHDSENYKRLFNLQMGALFYVIQRKLITAPASLENLRGNDFLDALTGNTVSTVTVISKDSDC